MIDLFATLALVATVQAGPSADAVPGPKAVAPQFEHVARTARVLDLDFGEAPPPWSRSAWFASPIGATLVPRVVIPGYEAIVSVEGFTGSRLPYSGIRGGDLALSGPPVAGDLQGTLYLPNFGSTGFDAFPFRVPADALVDDDFAYRIAHASRYSLLAGSGVPGAPWFRRRARAFGDAIGDLPPEPRVWNRSRDDTYAMFTGGRALAENLALDDVIGGGGGLDDATVSLSTIDGVRVPEMIWDGLVAEGDAGGPALDALSSKVPFDQHAVFFPSFDSLVLVADRLQADAAPIVHFLDKRAEDAQVRARYEAQMCLGLDAMTRRFGGTLIRSVAITGSDSYLRTGSDVAVLFEGEAGAIQTLLRSKIEAAAGTFEVEVQTLEVLGHGVAAAVNADRRLSVYLAATEDTVIVANSRHQMERVLSTAAGATESLADLSEFRWFRDRYRLGADDEDAFVMVSDATIRRWSSPHWRIASSRRTAAATALADADAFRIGEVLGLENAAAPAATSPVLGGGALALTGDVAVDATYGRLSFLTPIAELDIDKVTPEERDSYERWRRRYEAAWGTAFDPLGIRIDVTEDGLDVDLTLVPLVVRTDYRFLIGLAGDARLKAADGDAHAGTLAHWVCAIDKEGDEFKELERNLSGIPGLALGWLGDHMSIWLDRDEEYLERVQEADSFDVFSEEMLPGLPVAVAIDVDSALGLGAFLGAARGQLESAVPGLFTFGTSEHAGRSYVTIEVADGMGFEETPTLYYVVAPGRLVLSMSEKVIHGVIDRVIADEVGAGSWDGQSTALTLGDAFQDVAAVEMIQLEVRDQLRSRSWANLPILNEWRSQGIEDPVAYHAEQWGIRLVCPGGGEYVWSERFGTMESTAFGHPAAPKDGPVLPESLRSLSEIDFGLSFDTVETRQAEAREGENNRRTRRTPNRGLRVELSVRR